jgi:hypothetical protein
VYKFFKKGNLETKTKRGWRREDKRRGEERRGEGESGKGGVGAWVRPVKYNFVSVFALLRTRSVAFAFRQ